MKILLVEDDEILVANLAANLASQNYVVESATDGRAGLDYAQATEYDLIVLDVNLPGIDGISLCRQLRQANYEGAILLLTAKGDSRYKVSGLDAGADDYVVKPCPIDELSARIRALLRRPQGGTPPILQWGDLMLEPSTCRVRFATEDIALSPKEYGLLELFLRNPQRVFSSAMLLERLWAFDEIPGENTIRSHIKRLRRKLKRAGADEVIENIYGMGYRLMPSPAVTAPSQDTENTLLEEDSWQAHTAPEDLDATEDAEIQAKARVAAMAAIDHFSEVIADRVNVLDQAVAALQRKSLSEELQQQAKQAAHKLAGSLGMFGLIKGSHLSSEIELSLQCDRAVINCQQVCEWVSQLHRVLDSVITSSSKGTSADRVTNPSETICREDAAHSPLTFMPSVLVISTDRNLLRVLTEFAKNALHIAQATDLVQAQQQLLRRRLDTILLDMAAFPDWEANLPFLAQLAEAYPHLTVIVLIHQDSFQTRLEITRCCNCAFLPRSTPISQILDDVVEICQPHYPSTFHILAVDDDHVVLRTLEQQLSSCGMQITTLHDPRQLWDTLMYLKPDLLMLDIQMPHIEGIELCQVIRSDRYWSCLPILFLTACQDAETVLQMYRAGADDHITKPFTESELTTRILNRLKRNRSTQKSVSVDPTTGLMLEQQAFKDIHRNLTLAQRHRQPYCLALISVDSLESLSASGQPWLSNQILSSMANTLSQRLRQEDVLAHYTANVFLLGLYGIHKQQAEKRLDFLIRELHEIARQLLKDSALQPSFRMGLAAAPEEGENILTLRQLAKANLDRAAMLPSL